MPRPPISDRASLDRLRIGIAGWSYPDWRGTFYPARRPRGFSELRYAAARFDCIEINSTFYRPVAPRVAARWVETVRDLPRFTFLAKLPRELTHGTPRPSEVAPLSRPFLEGVRPLVEAERLGAILVQFPWSFADTPAHRDRLRALAEALRPLPAAVEVRHRSFLDPGPGGGLPFLGDSGLNFVNIDLPRSATAPDPTCANTGPVGYFRLHGRRRDKWFDASSTRDERYDYLYRAEELLELLEPMLRLARRTQVTYVILNNHFRGQAPANAIQLLRGIGRASPPVSAELRALYPQVEQGSPE